MQLWVSPLTLKLYNPSLLEIIMTWWYKRVLAILEIFKISTYIYVVSTNHIIISSRLEQFLYGSNQSCNDIIICLESDLIVASFTYGSDNLRGRCFFFFFIILFLKRWILTQIYHVFSLNRFRNLCVKITYFWIHYLNLSVNEFSFSGCNQFFFRGQGLSCACLQNG